MSAPPTERQAARQLREKGNKKKKKKRKTAEQGKREQVGLLYKFNTPTFPRVRPPLPRSPVALLQWAGAAGSQEARVFIVAWVSGWGVSGRESSYSAGEWPVSWKLQPLHDEFISPSNVVFFFSPLHTPTHPASVLYLSERRFNTAASPPLPLPLRWKCRPVVMHPVHLKLHRVSFHAALRPRAPFVHM